MDSELVGDGGAGVALLGELRDLLGALLAGDDSGVRETSDFADDVGAGEILLGPAVLEGGLELLVGHAVGHA